MYYVPKIKTETDKYGNFLDSTISLSVLTISASNADKMFIKGTSNEDLQKAS